MTYTSLVTCVQVFAVLHCTLYCTLSHLSHRPLLDTSPASSSPLTDNHAAVSQFDVNVGGDVDGWCQAHWWGHLLHLQGGRGQHQRHLPGGAQGGVLPGPGVVLQAVEGDTGRLQRWGGSYMSGLIKQTSSNLHMCPQTARGLNK